MEARVRSRPSSRIEPRLTRTIPVAARSRVDLPAPLGPMSAAMSPRATETETPCRTCTRPYPAVMSSRTSVIGGPPCPFRVPGAEVRRDDPLVGEHLGRCSPGQYLAMVQYEHLVGDRGDGVDDVFDHHQREAVAAQRVDEGERRVDLARAQSGQYLVQQQYPRPLRERLGQLEAAGVGDGQFG